MKARLEPKFQSVIKIVFLTIISLVVGLTSAAEAAPPGFVMFSPEFVESFQPDSSDPPEMSSPDSGQVDTEIIELARGLRYDPDLMYQFVHDKIEFKPFFSLFKGPYMTLMDRSGTVFDQAALLILLLKEAGYSDARFVKGKIQLSTAEMADWFGTSPDPDVIFDEFLSLVHFGLSVPSAAEYSYDLGSDTFTLSHVWVKVNIDGTDYVYDPSMKSHIRTAGIDLQSAMQYVRDEFLDVSRQESVLYGANIQADFLQNLNTSNLASDLSRYSNNLINYIKTNNPGATLDDIIGGLEIVPAPEPITRLTELPYEFPDPLKVEFGIDNVPEYYKCYIRLEHCGLTDSKRYYTSDIYGRRLTLFYNDDGPDNVYPVIYLDGDPQDSGTSVVRHTALPITIYYHLVGLESIGIPGLPNTSNVRAGGSYFIVNNWADTGTKIIEKHRKTLQQNRHSGLYSELDEPVLGESLAIIAFAWLAESSRIEHIIGSICGNYASSFITIGICGQGGQGGPSTSPFIDLHGVEININHSGDSVKKRTSFLAGSGHGSGFEGGVIEQFQPSRSAVSTVKLLDKSNSNSHKIFDATEANWDSIKNEIKDYSEGLKQDIDDLINDPTYDYRVILPEYGNLNEVAWTGGCYLAMKIPAGRLIYGISGGYKGGYSSSLDPIDVPEFIYSVPIDPVEPSSDNNPQTNEPIDLLTGNYIYEHTDLTVGSEYPFGLEFRRYYNSGSRLEDGSLGLGWSHNFDITAKVSSDGFQSMGIDSPVDAAASIVVAYIDMDLLTAEESLTNIMVVTLSQKWLMDQMIDNIVTIKQPGNTMQFVKLPDGTYNPPPGRAEKLALNNPGPDMYFSLKGKQGDVTEFNTKGLISNWSDSHNNTVTFQYEEYSEVVPGDYSYLNDYLVSHWKLDETEGTTAYDSVGDNDGTLYGNYTWISNGKIGGALELLDGAGDFVDVGDELELERQEFTLLFWVDFDVYEYGYYDGGVGKGYMYDIYGNQVSYAIRFSMQNYAEGVITNTDDNIYMIGTPIGDLDWHMWTITAGYGDFYLYKDSTQVGYDSYSGNIDYTKTYNQFRIGGPFGGDYPCVNGIIDDVMFFDKPLYHSEVAAIYLSRHKPQTVDKYRLTNVSNSFGWSLTFAYGGDESHIISVTDSAGRSVVYGYDPKWNLITVTDVENEDTTFEYDPPTNEGQLTKIFYPTDPVNPFVTNTYDSLGRVKEQTNANGYIYDYYYSYYRTEELEPSQAPPAEPPPPPPGGPPPPQRFSKIYYFNDHGNMVAEKDQLGREKTYEYDGQQRRVRVVYPTGNSTEYSYDENHNVTAIIKKPIQDSSEPDITEEFSYQSYESAAGRWFDLLKWQKDTAGNQTDYTYDLDDGPTGVGNLTKITYPAVYLPGGLGPFHPETSFTYNNYGQVLTETKKITDSDITIKRYEYYTPASDQKGALKETIVDDSGLNIKTSYDYDSVGNVKTITDPRGNVTTYEYYPSRRLKKETAPAPFNYKTHYEYYPDGKLKLVKRQTEDSDIWQITTYTYTPTGQKETVHGPTGNVAEDIVGENHGVNNGAQGVIGQIGNALSFDGEDYVEVPDDGSLDIGLNDMTIAAWFKSSTTGIKQHIVRKGIALTSYLFRIGEYNRLQAFIGDGENYYWIDGETEVTDDQWHHAAVVFDRSGYAQIYLDGFPNGNPEDISGVGNVTTGENLYIGKSYDGFYFNGIIDELMIFDRALLQEDIQQVYQNGVDGVNALTGFDLAEYPVSYWNFDQSLANLTKFEYDSLDRLWKTTDGENNTTERLYFPDGQLYKIVDAMNYSSVKNIYNPDGTLYSMSDAKGNKTTYEYDGHIRLKKTIYPDPSKFEELSYDDAGRLIAKRTRAGEIIGYIYDELNRLITKTVPGGNNITYEYDLLSRQVRISDESNTIIFNDFDKAGRFKSATYNYPSLGEKIVRYEYDAAGNRIKIEYPDDGKYVRYHYDNLNRLVSCSDDIIAYWNFDEGGGDIAHDAFGGNHGTIYGAEWISGRIGVALSFDGDDYVDIPDDDSLDIGLNDMTITAWFKSSTTGIKQHIVRKGIALTSYLFRIGEYNRLQAFIGDGENYYWIDGETEVTDDQWHHAAVVFDRSGYAQIYLDGFPDGNPVDISGVGNISTGENLYIGKSYDGFYFNGTIDEVRIHNKALSAPEVERLYQSSCNCVSRWSFDEASGTTARDSLSYNDGTVYGATWTTGKFGNSLSFDGDDHVEVPDDGSLDIGLNDMTIAAWFKATDTQGTRRHIVRKGLDTESYLLRIETNNKLQAFIGDGENYYWIDGETEVTDDQWHHAAVVFDRSGYAQIYLDGDPDGSPKDISDVGDITTDDNLRIGKFHDAYFKGIIDEVMIFFDRALLQEEIEAIYNGTNKGGGEIVSYTYDALSTRISARYGNDTNTEYYYDIADRLLALDNQTNNGNLSYDYSYDNANNRLTMLVNGTDLHSYTYDNIYQLTNVDYPEDFFTDNTSFTYDPAGNRWEVIGGGLGPYYSTNILNQYTSAGSVYFSYDDNGNLTGDGTYSYTYDAENRLMTANSSGLSIAYSYDPLGRRISKTIGGETTYYIYDGDQVICEYDSAGNLRKTFLYGVGIDEVVRMSQVGRTADIWGPANEPDGTVDIYDLRKMSEAWLKNEGEDGFNTDADLNYDGKINNTDSDILSANWLANTLLSEVHFYYHYDGLGSVIALSDSTGRVVEKYQYAVYGNPRIMNQNDKQLTESKYGNPYLFTGRRFDKETCLYYYRARYYSTEIGRFLQVDPIGYTDGMNLYTYCGNKPTIFFDPWGLCEVKFEWWSTLSDLHIQLLEGISDGVAITTNAMTLHLLEGRGIPGWADSTKALQRSGSFGQASKYLGYTAIAATAGAAAISYLGLDIVLWGGATAATNPEVQHQMHHFATITHSSYTPQFEQIAGNYSLSLRGAWNTAPVPGHIGRHAMEYHDFVLKNMQRAAAEAGASETQFILNYNQYVIQPVLENPDMLYKGYWLTSGGRP